MTTAGREVEGSIRIEEEREDLQLRSKERFKGYNHGRRRKKGDENDDV